MQYRNVGSSGLTVSRICLGTMLFGDQTDEATAKRMVDAARDSGINFIDSADVYVKGESERIVGRAIKKSRQSWVLATKCANPLDPDDANTRGLSRRWIMRAIDESLRRLDTDHIDIFYFHREDPNTALEESIRAVGDAIRAGKLRYFGLSNFRAWRHAEVVWLCRQLGVDKPIASQPYYNAMNRMPENEVLPACGHYGIGVVAYSPVARGVLTGKYRPGETPKKGTRAARQDKRMMETEFRVESMRAAQKIVAHAARRGMNPVQFAVNWVLANRFVTAVVAGPRTPDQLKDYLSTFDHQWTARDEALVNKLVASGHPSTPGYNDPAYPIEGRPI